MNEHKDINSINEVEDKEIIEESKERINRNMSRFSFSMRNRLLTIREYLTFDDVMFQPNYFDGDSRSNISIKSKCSNLELNFPVMSANMKHVTGKNMAVELAKHGGIGVLHRFQTMDEAVKEFEETILDLEELDNVKNPKQQVAVSIGVNQEDKERFCLLLGAGAKIFCIDIAHGHCKKMKEMLKYISDIKEQNGHQDNLTIIAGNIASAGAAQDLVNWGADVIKVGIGPGKFCQTRENTGAGVPQLSILEEIDRLLIMNGMRDKVGVIADGGLSKTADIAKALVYADAVMLGTMLAGTIETPGHVFENKDGEYYKVMAGSASAEEKTANGNDKKFVEGMTSTIQFKGHVKYIFRKIYENVQSSFSYSGAQNMEEFKKKARFVRLTNSGIKESKY